MANDGGQNRKPGFRTAVEDGKALATVLAMEAESIFGRRMALILGVLVLFGVLLTVGWYSYEITLWDWLKLLIVPVVIAAGGIWFNRQMRERELEIAERRTQDEALQAYLDQMSSMLLPNKDQPSLYRARPGDSLSSVARARTLTLLPRLDGGRKGSVVQFLYESGLIMKGRRIVDLGKADLEDANLNGINLRNVDLSSAYLRKASLLLTSLQGADLKYANLDNADLRGAYLNDANLHSTYLAGADLRGAHLNDANLLHTNLARANLNEAEGVSNESLAQVARRSDEFSFPGKAYRVSGGGPIREQQAPRHLEGATMPDGQKYEDWLKDREGHKEDENSGSS